MRDYTPSLSFRCYLAALAIDVSGFLTGPIKRRGFYNLTEVICKLVPQNILLQLTLDINTYFEIQLRDPYYGRLLHSPFIYEPEIEWLLSALKGLDYSFLDGGANWGYWSIRASSPALGALRTIAYEPMPRAFSYLKRNSELNGNRLELRNKAISPYAQPLSRAFSPGDGPPSEVGASLTIKPSGDNPRAITVECVTLDDAIAEFTPNHPLIIKLDIEGLESEVIRTSSLIHIRDCILCYEDHGADRECAASQAVFSMGWPVFFFTDSRKLIKFSSLEEIQKVKPKTTKGYNFFTANPVGDLIGRLNNLVYPIR